MKQQIEIIECFFVDETKGRIYRKRKGARKAIKKGHTVRAVVTTKEGEKLGTSNIVSIGKRYMKSIEDKIYVLFKH